MDGGGGVSEAVGGDLVPRSDFLVKDFFDGGGVEGGYGVGGVDDEGVTGFDGRGGEETGAFFEEEDDDEEDGEGGEGAGEGKETLYQAFTKVTKLTGGHLFNGNEAGLCDDGLSLRREGEVDKGGDAKRGIFGVIEVEGSNNGIGLVFSGFDGGCNEGSTGVIGDGDGFNGGIEVGEADVADGTFGLGDGLDDSTGGGEGEDAVDVVFVFKYGFFEELVGTGGGFTGVGDDL